MVSSHTTDTDRVLPGQVLARVSEVTRVLRSADVELLVLACEWADAHPLLPDDEPHPGGARAARREREATRQTERLRIAADWLATEDPTWDYDPTASPEDWLPDPWLPEYAWDCAATFAAARGVPTRTGARLMDDALFLRHRMPRLWVRVLAGEVEVWRARRIAQIAWRQPADVVDALDLEVTPRAHSIGVAGLDKLVDDLMARLHAEIRELDQVAALEARHVTVNPDPLATGLADIAIRADFADALAFDRACSVIATALAERCAAEGGVPDGPDVRRSQAVGILADPERAAALLRGGATDQPDDDGTGAGSDPDRPLAPGLVLHVHVTDRALLGHDPLADVTAQPSRGRGGRPRTQLADLVAQWASRPSTSLTVKPVIDLTEHHESRSESPTVTAQDRAALRRPTCTFPFCDQPASACDTDHCVAVADDGPTCDCNLTPLCRHHHRLKTHAGWSYTPVGAVTGGGGGDVRGSPPGHPGPATSWLWRSPHGMQFLVDDLGTRDVTDVGWSG
jgi:hypothetical protein